jgi:hypothetical protein
MKLTLIPILRTFCTQEGGGTGGASASGGKDWQVIQSPQGHWRFRAPAGWRAAQGPHDDDVMAIIVLPDEEGVVVRTGVGGSDYLWFVKNRLVPPANVLPLMTAADLFQRVIIPYHVLSFGIADVKIVELKTVRTDVARFVITYSNRAGKKFTDEGFVKNSSAPNPQEAISTFTPCSGSGHWRSVPIAKRGTGNCLHFRSGQSAAQVQGGKHQEMQRLRI